MCTCHITNNNNNNNNNMCIKQLRCKYISKIIYTATYINYNHLKELIKLKIIFRKNKTEKNNWYSVVNII